VGFFGITNELLRDRLSFGTVRDCLEWIESQLSPEDTYLREILAEAIPKWRL
jgi:hypothetical protein